MRFTIQRLHLGKALAETEKDIERAVTSGMRDAADGLKQDIREDVVAAGLQSIDLLFEKGMKAIRLAAPRMAVTMRGTGCALSTAIGAAMANKQPLVNSSQIAKTYVLGQMQIGLI